MQRYRTISEINVVEIVYASLTTMGRRSKFWIVSFYLSHSLLRYLRKFRRSYGFVKITRVRFKERSKSDFHVFLTR